MNINEIVGRLKAGGLDASSNNRSAAVYVTEARSGRSEPGWFGFRIICDSEATERRVRSILSRWYDINVSGGVWRLRSKNRVPLMAIKRGGVPPTPPTPTEGPMYFEAAEANSTVSMISTLATAPNLEYSTDGVTWQEWEHTTTTEDDMTMHTFDTLTLTAIGDRVYLRGNNPNGLSDINNDFVTWFSLTGKINSSGSLTSILDNDGVSTTELPEGAFTFLFGYNTLINMEQDSTLLTPPTFGNIETVKTYSLVGTYYGCAALESLPDMSRITHIGYMGCGVNEGGIGTFTGCSNASGIVSFNRLSEVDLYGCCHMFGYCNSMYKAADMPSLSSLGPDSLRDIYDHCTFAMSDNGTTFNFAFGATPPVTAGEETFNTYYDLAEWMGNTNGFTEP